MIFKTLGYYPADVLMFEVFQIVVHDKSFFIRIRDDIAAGFDILLFWLKIDMGILYILQWIMHQKKKSSNHFLKSNKTVLTGQ